jgi:retinol-binding protein 3
MKRIKYLRFYITTFLLTTSTVVFSNNLNVSKQEQAEVIDKISQLLKEEYIDPAIAEKSSIFIQRQFEVGAYEKLFDSEAFGKKISRDLQSVSHDAHMYLSLRKPKAVQQETNDPELAQIQRRRIEKQNNYGFKKVELLEGNVGYINFNHFSGHDSATKTAAAALHFLSNVDALIIDLRENHGGASSMVQFFLSYFFNEKTLLEIVTRRNKNEREEFWTLEDMPGKRLDEIPLYVLISRKSSSGGEKVPYLLQAHKRATIIGEVSAGADLRGDFFRVNERYSMFVSTAKSISPLTGESYGRAGVVPDIKVSAINALEKAYSLAKVEAKKYGDFKATNKITQLRKSVFNFLNAEKELKLEDARALIHKQLDLLVNNFDLDETALNDMGYRYLQLHQNPNVASIVFEYNAEQYPTSYNVWGSLADSYLELGQIELAVKNYKKALSIEPKDGYSLARLERLNTKYKENN